MANYFTKDNINFGTIRANSSKTFTFNGIIGIPEVKSIDAACGCTKIKYDAGTRNLTVKYKAGNIPNQVVGNKQKVHKTLTVYYTNGESEELSLSGFKIR